MTIGDAEFSNRWVAVRGQIAQGTKGHVRMDVLNRWVWLGESSFQIGNVTHIEAPKTEGAPSEEYKHEKIAALLAKGFRIKKWNYRRVRSAHVYEGEWDHGLRFVRLYFVEREGHYSFSIANFRMSYADSVVIESELLQRKLAGVLDEDLPWLDRVYSMLEKSAGIETAHAEGLPAGCPPGPGSPPWVLINCANASQGQLVNQMGAFNNQLAGINGQLGALNGNAATANKNWAATNAAATSAANAANKNWQATNAQLAGFNQNWQQSNALLEKALSPTNALYLGLATGAGIAAGTALVSLASTGITEAAKGLYELITRKASKAENIAAFEKAMNDYDKVKDQIAQWEAKLDSAMYLKNLANHYSGREKGLLKRYNEIIKRNEILSRMASEDTIARMREGANPACISKLIENGAEYDSVIRQTTKLRDILESAGDDGLCDSMKKAIDNIMQAEATLDKARREITGTNRIADWKEAQEEDFSGKMKTKTSKDVEALSDWRREKSAYEATFKKQALILATDRRDAILKCAQDRMPKLLGFIPLGEIPIFSLPAMDIAKLRSKCETDLYGKDPSTKACLGSLCQIYEQKVTDNKSSLTEKVGSATDLYWRRMTANESEGPNVWAHTSALVKMNEKLAKIFDEQKVFTQDDRMGMLGQKDGTIAQLCK